MSNFTSVPHTPLRHGAKVRTKYFLYVAVLSLRICIHVCMFFVITSHNNLQLRDGEQHYSGGNRFS